MRGEEPCELSVRTDRDTPQIILRLIRVFNNGAEIKRRTDVAIDACSVMQNLRHAIKEYKVKTEEAQLRLPPSLLVRVCACACVWACVLTWGHQSLQ